MTKNIIPTINISSILNKDYSSKKSIKTINKIKKACINIGFFQVINHGINKILDLKSTNHSLKIN